jgi:hypothetical protein
MFCPYCDAELDDAFPDGVCNYISRSKNRGQINKEMNEK